MTLKVKHICAAIAALTFAPITATAHDSGHNHNAYNNHQQLVRGYSQPVTVNPYHGGGDFRKVTQSFVLYPQATARYSLRPHTNHHQGHGSSYDLKYHGFHGNYSDHRSNRSSAFSRLFGSRRRSSTGSAVSYYAVPMHNMSSFQTPMQAGSYTPYGN